MTCEQYWKLAEAVIGNIGLIAFGVLIGLVVAFTWRKR